MNFYNELATDILLNGTHTEKENGVDTISLFGVYYKLNMANGFPLITNRKISFDAVVDEFLWLVSGSTHVNNNKLVSRIWNTWTDKDGYLESPYGLFWRRFPASHSLIGREMWVDSESKHVYKNSDGFLFYD